MQWASYHGYLDCRERACREQFGWCEIFWLEIHSVIHTCSWSNVDWYQIERTRPGGDRSGRSVCITIRYSMHNTPSDNGSGIDPENYDKLGIIISYLSFGSKSTSPQTLYLNTARIRRFRKSFNPWIPRRSLIFDISLCRSIHHHLSRIWSTNRCATAIWSSRPSSRTRPAGQGARYAFWYCLMCMNINHQGTTVILKNVFECFPVRLKEFKKNAKREYAKCVELLQSYAVIQTNVRMTVSHISSKGYDYPWTLQLFWNQKRKDDCVLYRRKRVLEKLDIIPVWKYFYSELFWIQYEGGGFR